MAIQKKKCSKSDLKFPWPISLITISSLIASIGICLAIWIDKNNHLLPTANSSEGRALLRLYLGYAHDIFLVLTLAWTCKLTLIARRHYKKNKRKYQSTRPFLKNLIEFGSKNPLTSIILACYAIAIIYGSSYLYYDMIGWYPDLINGNLLDNFSIRYSFVNETMRRSDFRFFPLAHQDLHILSWFTVQIKTWLLFCSFQLFLIVFFCTKIVENLSIKGKVNHSSLAIFITIILLFHPSTVFTFFHVIYSERTVGTLFAAYLYCYIRHAKENKNTTFYTAIILASIGSLTKDIAIILFVTPSIVNLALEAKKMSAFGPNHLKGLFSKLLKSNKLDLYILLLIPVFIASYVVLSLIPGVYASEGLYNEGNQLNLNLDIRITALGLLTITRVWMAIKKLVTLNILDSFNIAAFIYGTALLGLTRLKADDYQSFPLQIVIIINAAYAWSKWIEPWIKNHLNTKKPVFTSIIFAAGILIFEHLQFSALRISSVYETAKWIKLEQISNQANFEHLDETLRQLKRIGNEVNLIINEKSRLSRERFLGQLKYDRLIEYDSKTKAYLIKDGINKGQRYLPKSGDIVASIDQNKSLLDPILEQRQFTIIYKDQIVPNKGLFVRLE